MDNPLLDSSSPPAQPSLGTPPAALPVAPPQTSSRFHAPPIHNLGDLLDFQRAALHEAIFHGGTSDANRAALRKVISSLPRQDMVPGYLLNAPLTEFLKYGADHYAQMPHALQGVYDAVLDTGTDPLTLETADTGPLTKYVGTYGSKVLSAVDKAHLPVWGPGIITDISHAATRLLNFGGEAINQVGRGRWMQAVGMLNRQRAEQRELYRRLSAMDSAAMAGLTKAQTSAVQKVLHGQLPPELEERVLQDQKIAMAAKSRKNLTDALVRMQASPGSGLEDIVGSHPLPRELQEFAGRPGEFTSANYRAKYFPGHNYEKVVDPNRPAREFNMLEPRNPHILEQTPFKISSSKVDEFEKAFDGMLKTSARAITANKAIDELGKVYGGVQNIPPSIRDIFTVTSPATGTERTVGQKAAESIRGLVNLPKLGIVGTTPIHMFNILSLLLARAPEQVPLAALHFARIVRAGGDEVKRFEAMLPAIERGVDIATHEKAPGILGKLAPTRVMNRWTWDWDTAAKTALSDKYVKSGMHPLEAGVRASNELVNYANHSPLNGMLQWFMPFATFAEGGAKAVLGATAKQPALVELENRLLGGRFLGGGNPKTDTTLYQPTANVGRGLPTYLRSKTSDLVKLPVALGAQSLPGGKQLSKWLLSGRTPAGTALDIGTSPVPYLRDVIDMIPAVHGKTLRGYAPDPIANQALFSSTGISLPHKAKATVAPPNINPLLPPTPNEATTSPTSANPLLGP